MSVASLLLQARRGAPADPYAAAVLGETSLDIGVEALALLSWRRLRAQLYTQIGD